MSQKLQSNSRGCKTIRIPCSEEEHSSTLKSSSEFRAFLDNVIKKHPEIFPADISVGYHIHGFTAPSVKLAGFVCYRIKILATGDVYTVAPSCVIPYMRGRTNDIKDAFFC